MPNVFEVGDRVRQDHIGLAVICGKQNDDQEWPAAALDTQDYVDAYGSVDEDAELVARAIYFDAEDKARIKNAATLLDERGMWMAAGHLRDILKRIDGSAAIDKSKETL